MTIIQQLTLCKTGTLGIISQLLFVGMYGTQGRYNVRVSKLRGYYGLNHLHYLTTIMGTFGCGNLISRKPRALTSDSGFCVAALCIKLAFKR